MVWLLIAVLGLFVAVVSVAAYCTKRMFSEDLYYGYEDENKDDD